MEPLDQSTRPTPNMPRWTRLAISLLVGVATGFLDYQSRNKVSGSFAAKTSEWLARGILAAIAGALLFEIWSFKNSIDDLLQRFKSSMAEIAAELKSIREHALGDERIIFARQQLNRDSRSIAVLGIESVDPVPEALHYLPQSGPDKWERSISILRFDRIQDLLFSRDYLEHFFSLPLRASGTSRILVINDLPRSKDAVRSFLQISESAGIKTYVYRKSEFYTMLDLISTIVPPEDAGAVREIMAGNPELNLMARNEKEFRPSAAKQVTASTDYVLRYLSVAGGRSEIVTRAPGPLGHEVGTLPGNQVTWVFRLMTSALKDARRGLKAFDHIVSDNGAAPENFWSQRSLQEWKKRREYV